MGEALTVQTRTETPRIYVACLAAYNNGYLHGAWIDATGDEWTIWEGIRVMLAASPIADAEEYAIHDYEGFAGMRIAEYADITSVSAIAAFVAEHGALGGELLAHYGGDLEEARAAMDDRYLGSFASLADYVQEITEDAGTVPEALRSYIDWAAMARDAEINGDLLAIEIGHQQIHVFTGH